MAKFSLALVTGASSGIGEALCRLLAHHKIDLIISGRNGARLAQLQEALQNQVAVTSIIADLGIASERQRLIEIIQLRKPDLAINNAGFGLYGEALMHSTAAQMEILNVNGNALLEMSLEAARAMLAESKKGVILNVASAAAFHPFPYLAVYAASKAFVVQFSQALDLELEPSGIRVLVACPGMVTTQFSSRASHQPQQTDPLAMTAEFAAERIWKQICKGESCCIFNWKYRLGNILSHFIPKKRLAHFLRKRIASRILRL